MTLHAQIKAFIDDRTDVVYAALGTQPAGEKATCYLAMSGGGLDESGGLVDYTLHTVVARRDDLDVSAQAEMLVRTLAEAIQASDLPVAVAGFGALAEWVDPNPRAESAGWWSVPIELSNLTPEPL